LLAAIVGQLRLVAHGQRPERRNIPVTFLQASRKLVPPLLVVF
jgi:hypothetical protein